MMRVMKRGDSWKMAFICFSLFLLIISCNEEDSGIGFTTDFSYEFIDDNHVQFTNESVGEYYSLLWDFGLGETSFTTDKSKTFEIYFPEAGDYDVSLKVSDYTGNREVITKTISITNTDIALSFSAEVDPSNPNLVNLKNTTIGDYDSFKWMYRNREIENEIETVVYFPFSGNYEIELQVIKGSDTFTSLQTVAIPRDDPDYVDNLTLTWAEEFDGSGVNTTNWNFETGAGGWGNQELQNYTNGDNAEVSDGTLKIIARKVNENKVAGSYTSTRMTSRNNFLYGRIEARLKQPSGTGVWSAFWMLGSNINSVGWPACGEIDIMEYVGHDANITHSALHTPSSYSNTVNKGAKFVASVEEEFHVYGIIWTEKSIEFYVDDTDNVFYTYSPSAKTDDTWPFDKSQFIILNLAIGGTWGGAQGIDNTIFPQTYEIDYVRVYQETN